MFQLGRVGLNFLGAWPGYLPSKLLFVALGAISTALIFQTWNLFLIGTELDLLMNNLGTSMPMISFLLKFIAFRLKYSKVKTLINEMLVDWNTNQNFSTHKEMLKNNTRALYLSNAIAICYNGLVFSYLAIAIMSYNSNFIEDRQFVMQATFPINAKKSPIFEIVCFLQFMIALTATNGHVVMEGLLTVSVFHASTKAFSVCQKIKIFSETCRTILSEEIKLKATQDLVLKHLNFINFVNDIQDVFSYVAFFHLFLMTLINCIVGYMLINITSLTRENAFTILMCIAYMFTALSAVASYCIAGEYIKSQSSLIFEELYDCPWYHFKPFHRKTLIFMIMRSRKPLTLTVGHFGDLSLTYLTKILKTSISYLSLVRASSV